VSPPAKNSSVQASRLWTQGVKSTCERCWNDNCNLLLFHLQFNECHLLFLAELLICTIRCFKTEWKVRVARLLISNSCVNIDIHDRLDGKQLWLLLIPDLNCAHEYCVFLLLFAITLSINKQSTLSIPEGEGSLISHKRGGFIDGSDVIHKILRKNQTKNLEEILESKKTDPSTMMTRSCCRNRRTVLQMIRLFFWIFASWFLRWLPILFLLVLRFTKGTRRHHYSKDKTDSKDLTDSKGSKDTNHSEEITDSLDNTTVELQKDVCNKSQRDGDQQDTDTREVKDTSSKEDKRYKITFKDSGNPSILPRSFSQKEDSSRPENWSRVHVLKEETLSRVRRQKETTRKQEETKKTPREIQRENQGGITQEGTRILYCWWQQEERTQSHSKKKHRESKPGEESKHSESVFKITKSKHRDRKKEIIDGEEKKSSRRSTVLFPAKTTKKEEKQGQRTFWKKEKARRREEWTCESYWRNQGSQRRSNRLSYFFDAILISITQQTVTMSAHAVEKLAALEKFLTSLRETYGIRGFSPSKDWRRRRQNVNRKISTWRIRRESFSRHSLHTICIAALHEKGSWFSLICIHFLSGLNVKESSEYQEVKQNTRTQTQFRQKVSYSFDTSSA